MTAWSAANLHDMELNDAPTHWSGSYRDPFADGGWACGGLVAGCELQAHEWDVDFLTARERLVALLLMSAEMFDWWPGHERRLLRDSAFTVSRLELRDPQQTWQRRLGPEVAGQRMHYWLMSVGEATRRGMSRRCPPAEPRGLRTDDELDALREVASASHPVEHLFSPPVARGPR